MGKLIIIAGEIVQNHDLIHQEGTPRNLFMVQPVIRDLIKWPSHDKGSALALIAAVSMLASYYPKSTWIVTSFVTSKDGAPRPGTSHEIYQSIDVIPCQLDQEGNMVLRLPGTSPMLNEKLTTLLWLANKIEGKKFGPDMRSIAFVAESDHIHIQLSKRTAVFIAPGFKPSAYSNDVPRSQVGVPWLRRLTRSGDLVRVAAHSDFFWKQ